MIEHIFQLRMFLRLMPWT